MVTQSTLIFEVNVWSSAELVAARVDDAYTSCPINKGGMPEKDQYVHKPDHHCC